MIFENLLAAAYSMAASSVRAYSVSASLVKAYSVEAAQIVLENLKQIRICKCFSIHEVKGSLSSS